MSSISTRCSNNMASRVFTAPYARINEQYQIVDLKIKKLETAIKQKLNESKNKEIELISKLDTLSPLKTLTRGYTITQKNGQIIKSLKDLKTNDIIDLKFIDGEKQARVLD